jgi:hypothetical protein
MVYGLALAMNSLVSPGDIKKLKEAQISRAVIQTLMAEQTSSINSDYLIMLKKAGADDEMLKSVILADRYKNPKKADLSLEQMEILKKAGFSDEVIVRLFNVAPTKRVVDEHGNESVIYGTGLDPEPPTSPPDQTQGTFNINIERITPP